MQSFVPDPTRAEAVPPIKASDFDLPDFCRDVGIALALPDPAQLQTGAVIGEERVFLLYDEDLDDGVTMLFDFASLTQADDRLLRVLMEINLELSAERGESFALDAEAGRVVFRAFVHDGHFTPASVARDIELYVQLLGELRSRLTASPLGRPA